MRSGRTLDKIRPDIVETIFLEKNPFKIIVALIRTEMKSK